jgi:saccharopine dehydrogenase (NAD+, L-lysine-forming)
MKIGILRETKDPPDRRVPLTPAQCKQLLAYYPGIELVVQPSLNRCFTDAEYVNAGLLLQEDLQDCELLMGVKEVDIPALIEGKTYLFFSHTAKEQPFNRELLQEISRMNITLVDYEYLVRTDNSRVVAFGRWAGIVGAYNGLRAYGQRTGAYTLRPAWKLSGLDEMKMDLANLPVEHTRIVLTGGGRVAQGAMEILRAAGIREVTPMAYLADDTKETRYCRLDPWHYARHIHNLDFNFDHFVDHPDAYENTFQPYARKSDMYIACHFWDPRSPLLLTREDLQDPEIPIRVVADISCDIDGPIASTIRPSTIANPFYGYDPVTGKAAEDSFKEDVITVMAVDNLPGELPRDASGDFGEALMKNVLPSLLGDDKEGIVRRATITRNGALTEPFWYLENYLKG